MTEMILGWQAVILVSMVIARLVSSSAMIKLGFFWTVWTCVMLFWGPLILLQLITIWAPVGFMAKREPLKPKAAVSQIEPQKKQRGLVDDHVCPRATPVAQVTGVSSSPLGLIEESQKNLTKLTGSAKIYLDKIGFRLEFKKPFTDQKHWIGMQIDLAKIQAEVERKTEADPRFRELYEISRAKFEVPGTSDASDDFPKKLPSVPQRIEWPLDPIKRGVMVEVLAEHLAFLENAAAQIDQERFLRPCLIALRGPEIFADLVHETEVVRGLLGLAQKHIKAESDTIVLVADIAHAKSDFLKTVAPNATSSSAWLSHVRTATNPAVRPPVRPRRIIASKPPVADGNTVRDQEPPPDSISKSETPDSPVAPGVQVEDAVAIRAVSERHGIPHLTHFTKADNLQSILRHGLLSRDTAKSLGIDQPHNDRLRLDRRMDRISTSVAFPNYSMFYKYRSEVSANDWVVILLKKEILWSLDCLFLPCNAADARVIPIEEKELTNHKALERLFVRGSQPDVLRSCFPTDPQAEVMVKSRIDPVWIDAIAFETVDAMRRYARITAGHEVFYCGFQSGLFGARPTNPNR